MWLIPVVTRLGEEVDHDCVRRNPGSAEQDLCGFVVMCLFVVPTVSPFAVQTSRRFNDSS